MNDEQRALEVAKEAMRVYFVESSGGLNPHTAAAALKVAAKEWARAEGRCLTRMPRENLVAKTVTLEPWKP
jgi:hypothetical protein